MRWNLTFKTVNYCWAIPIDLYSYSFLWREKFIYFSIHQTVSKLKEIANVSDISKWGNMSKSITWRPGDLLFMLILSQLYDKMVRWEWLYLITKEVIKISCWPRVRSVCWQIGCSNLPFHERRMNAVRRGIRCSSCHHNEPGISRRPSPTSPNVTLARYQYTDMAFNPSKQKYIGLQPHGSAPRVSPHPHVVLLLHSPVRGVGTCAYSASAFQETETSSLFLEREQNLLTRHSDSREMLRNYHRSSRARARIGLSDFRSVKAKVVLGNYTGHPRVSRTQIGHTFIWKLSLQQHCSSEERISAEIELRNRGPSRSGNIN